MAKTMKPRLSIVIDGEIVTIDPQLLFQRLLIMTGMIYNLDMPYHISYVLFLQLYLEMMLEA